MRTQQGVHDFSIAYAIDLILLQASFGWGGGEACLLHALIKKELLQS